MGIIYKATNILNNNCYVGKTKYSLDFRRNGHITAANNMSKSTFHCAIRKYGIEAFVWDVICESDSDDELSTLEIYYIRNEQFL